MDSYILEGELMCKIEIRSGRLIDKSQIIQQISQPKKFKSGAGVKGNALNIYSNTLQDSSDRMMHLTSTTSRDRFACI